MKGNNIPRAAEFIRNGGLVAFPTETVYGLGADAFNPQAVARIFEVKQRPSFDPLIVHIADFEQVYTLFSPPVSDWVEKLANAFWPGPLTIVHRKSPDVPDIVTSGLNTVAVRMPSHPIARRLIAMAGTPVAAPSANRFGQLSPTQPRHVLKQLTGFDYLLLNGYEMVGIESTVVSVEGNGCRLLRPGAITLQQLEAVVPCIQQKAESHDANLPSPGLLKSHYSPEKPLYILEEGMDISAPGAGFILHRHSMDSPADAKVFYTSQDYNFTEIAANLFIALHTMEEDGSVSRIYIEPVEETGLGVAIMDRVRKAAFRYR